MLHITLGAERTVDPATDELGRDRVGYGPTMSQEDLYTANRAAWVLGARADTEPYALIGFAGVVRQAIAVETLETYDSGRRGIIGQILQPGDFVYDLYVDKPSPIGRVRNPITYFQDDTGTRTCACGCKAPVTRRDFLPGHDQRAIHERITRRWGSTLGFITWFDQSEDQAT